jgi:hypothetical protein
MTVKNVIVRNSKIVGTGKYGLIYLGIKAVFDNVVFENCIGNFVNCERFVLLGDSANPTPLSRLVFRGGEWEGNTANPHGNNAGIWVQTANEIGDLVFEDTHFKNFHNILNLSGGATTRLHLIRSKFTGCTKIVNNFGQNSPLTVYRQGTTIDIDDGSLFYSLYHNSTSIITFVSGENPVVYQANGTGTVYTFQSYVQAVTFGTTSPSVTVARRGTYRARARLLVKFNGATFTSAQTLRVRYRYGGSYATFQTVITLPIMTALTDTRIIEMPEYLYSWTAPGTEVVTLHADMSASPSAGTVTCEECEITLIPLTQI